MSSYDALKETITKLIDYPIEDWCITQLSAETCLEQLDKYEAQGMPVPKMFIESQGVTITWVAGDWKLYQHFFSDSDDSEVYFFWNKK